MLLYVKQSKLLYFPTPAADVPNAQRFSLASDVGSLSGWVVNAGQPNALIYFGGNGEQVERNAEFLSRCVPAHSVYILPYRGYGGNPGVPSQTALFDDALRLEQFVKAKHERVDLLGRSLGTGVSVYVASKRQISKLVLVTPYDSIANVAAEKYPIFPVRWLLKDKYESINYARDVKASVKIVVAGNDAVIPPKHALMLVQKFTHKPVLETIFREGHNSISSSSRYENAVCSFLR